MLRSGLMVTVTIQIVPPLVGGFNPALPKGNSKVGFRV